MSEKKYDDLTPLFITIPNPHEPERFVTLAVPVEHPLVRHVKADNYVMADDMFGMDVRLDRGLSGARLWVAAAVFADWYQRKSDEAHYISHGVNYLTYANQWREVTARVCSKEPSIPLRWAKEVNACEHLNTFIEKKGETKGFETCSDCGVNWYPPDSTEEKAARTNGK